MRTITAILNSLTDFSLPAAVAKMRLEALQPTCNGSDSLDFEHFLSTH